MIAIKGMEIPKSCIECPLRMLGKCYHLKSSYELKGFDIFEEKPKGCPLVEIITCKDCKNCWCIEGSKNKLCEKHGCMKVSNNFYCADGERKE